MIHDIIGRVRPDIPRPACRVRLVCGPPAAGKSTFVNEHASLDDIVIDLDSIARELGFGRLRPKNATPQLLDERNRRLAALTNEPRERVAWVILAAPSRSLRQWWCGVLGVTPPDLTVLIAPREELYRRIVADPDRRMVRRYHMALVNKWLEQERTDNPGMFSSGADVNGFPTDPLHPWNRRNSHAATKAT